MKKSIIYVSFIFSLFSCSIKYYGYVYDFDTHTPINKVKIYTKDSIHITYSKGNGYFEINLKEKTKEFIFDKKGHQQHYLKTLSIQSGEFTKELPFGDTIYLISKDSKYKRPNIKLSN